MPLVIPLVFWNVREFDASTGHDVINEVNWSRTTQWNHSPINNFLYIGRFIGLYDRLDHVTVGVGVVGLI
jgi:hypothetical protein